MLGLALLLATAAAPPPVILVTVDGVRIEEVFDGLDARLARAPGQGGTPLLPRLLARAAREGFLTGDPRRADPFPVLDPAAVSLPGYQAILAGRDTGCPDNRCGRIRVETVLERARRELGLEAGEVAVVAGWPQVALAASSVPGAVAVSAGFAPLRPGGDEPDGASEALAAAAGADEPPWPYRRDRHTWAQALHHLERARPRLLWIALGDPDEWAHLDDYRAYAASLEALDEGLEALFAALAAMGEYGAGASVLVTTDHGRGAGDGWSGHGPALPGSGLAWLFASTPATRAAPGRAGRGRYDQGSIRPTIEALLGLPPCRACQRAIPELVESPPAALAGRSAAGAGGP